MILWASELEEVWIWGEGFQVGCEEMGDRKEEVEERSKPIL